MSPKMTKFTILLSFIITFICVLAKTYVLAGCAFIFGSLFMVFYKGGDK